MVDQLIVTLLQVALRRRILKLQLLTVLAEDASRGVFHPAMYIESEAPMILAKSTVSGTKR